MLGLGKRLDLQAKVILVLVAVILPTFLIVTFAENKLTQPILEDEIRQVGVTSGKTLAAEIVSSRLLQLPNPGHAIEDRMQEILYSQPNIVRIDVVSKDAVTGLVKTLASNIEEDPGSPQPVFGLVEAVTSEYRMDDNGSNSWEISVPIEQRARVAGKPRKLLGTVHLVISAKVVESIMGTLWRTTFTAAAFSVVCLIVVLSYFLRKTIANDRLLREAETQNVQLTEQLHETQRQLMNTEKLAVMGQLTASFAHEIGTPLNAISGHLQLLQEELESDLRGEGRERLGIINGQVGKIEQIVKGFLQSTAKPTSQRQLVDVNRLVDKTIGIVRPRIEALHVDVRRSLDHDLGPVRAVPLDLEQILLNLVNNSLDSLRSKAETRDRSRLQLEVSTSLSDMGGKQWAQVEVYDTGEGIRKADLKSIFKPFFTTKRPGEGTGLGLTICQQLAHKHGGVLEIDSKEGNWTRVTLRVPYQAT
jgi:signal transduction histidine kinase